MKLAISAVIGLLTIGAEVAASILAPKLQNPIVVNNNVAISVNDYESSL